MPTITPGTVCVFANPFFPGETYEMVARSNVVNGTVQFQFVDGFTWVPVSDILWVKSDENWAERLAAHNLAVNRQRELDYA